MTQRVLRQGRYEIRRVLGEGAQGTTLEALDRTSGRLVAIKRFNVTTATQWKDVELAEREARVLATLDHPFLPRYVEHFEEEGSLYLVMEKVEGETVDALLRHHGALPEDEVGRFLASADHALTYLHGRASPVIHRDVKPRNVVRRPDGAYVLVDFGTVRELMRPRGGSTIVGTYGFMAPEQLHGRAFPATDVYAVGATALTMLAGADPDTLPTRGLRLDVRRVLQGRVSEGMIASLERMLEPDPELRAPSLRAAMSAGPTRLSSPAAMAPAPPIPSPFAASDEALARSIRKLLWALWGLAWIIVPILVAEVLHAKEAWIPVIMFGWLAANLLAGWHNCALIRYAIREWRESGKGKTSIIEHAPPQVRIDAAPPIRVQTSPVAPPLVEPFGQTQISAQMPASPRQMQAQS